MLEHFTDCMKTAKHNRQEAIHINIFTALLLGLKQMGDQKITINQEEVKRAAANLIMVSWTQ